MAYQDMNFAIGREKALRSEIEDLVRVYERKSETHFELMRKQPDPDVASEMRKRAQDFSTVAAKLRRALGDTTGGGG